MRKLHIMLDLETLGKKVMAPIVQIGAATAVEDDTVGKMELMPAVFDVSIALDSAMEKRKPDASTIIWWMNQNKEVRNSVLAEEGPDVVSALQYFIAFVTDAKRFYECEEVYVWGNGASSDNAWLISLYEQYDMDPPWEYWGNMCYRTIKNLNRHVPRPELPEHLKHNALADARSQMTHLIAIYNQRSEQ